MPNASPPTRLRVGIVGLGFGERVLLPAFRAASRCDVVGVCAGSWEHAHRVADRFLGVIRARGGGRYEAMN